MLYLSNRVGGGLEDKEGLSLPKKFENDELETLVYVDQCQTLQEFSESLKRMELVAIRAEAEARTPKRRAIIKSVNLRDKNVPIL